MNDFGLFVADHKRFISTSAILLIYLRFILSILNIERKKTYTCTEIKFFQKNCREP